MGSKIQVVFKSNAVDYAKWISTVPRDVQLEIENKRIPYLKTATKEKVKEHLHFGAGVEEGIYRKSFTINSFAEKKWQVGFQVYAKKPHYRLTHLLEYGHDIWLFRWGIGRPTKWGNIGMSKWNTKLHGDHTTPIPHIAPAQQYAEERMEKLYKDAYTGKLEERMRKLG